MKRKIDFLKGYFAIAGMLIMILDTQTALIGAKTGIQLCLQTVVPSLFPFLVLSGILNNHLWGKSIPFLRPIATLCKIPKGSESLLLLGLTGGYPVGAQLIYQCYEREQLTKAAAKRMLGFCNNAGPAFIFGMFSSVFSKSSIPWFLWIIHIISAILTGIILPSNSQNEECTLKEVPKLSLSNIIQNTIKVMSTISAWIVFFKVILAFCNKWFIWMLDPILQVLFAGITELSNGCILLKIIQEENIRFIMASVILASGGLCVGMQVSSVVKELGMGMYFPGKILQVFISYILSMITQFLIFDNCNIINSICIGLCLCLLLFSYSFIKKRYSIRKLHSI